MNVSNLFDPGTCEHLSIVRRPIMDLNRNVAGNELYAHTQASCRGTVASDISLLVNAIANKDAPYSTGRLDLFVPASPDGLAGSHWDFLDPKRVVAVVPLIENNEPIRIANVAVDLEKLRARGFRLTFHHSVVAPLYKSWHGLADFVMLDPASVSNQHLGPLVSAIHTRTNATAIATKVGTPDQFSQLRSLGLSRFQGPLFSEPEVFTPRLLVSAEVAAIELLNLVSKSAPIDAVENALKKDPVLVVNLLRIINSAGVGLGHKVTSLREATMLMGYKKLTQWSAMVLAMSSLYQENSNLLHFNAIVRGRMMELLAEQNAEHLDPGSAFLIGLLSKLDAMLGSPMQTALGKLSMNSEISDFLLGREGVYGDLLSLAKACESGLEADFSRPFSRLSFTLRQIHKAHTDALAWADGVFCRAYT